MQLRILLFRVSSDDDDDDDDDDDGDDDDDAVGHFTVWISLSPRPKTET